MKPWENPYYEEDYLNPDCGCYGCATMRYACQYENKKEHKQNGRRATNPFEIKERRRLIQQLGRKSTERYLADAKKGANQEYYYAERELKEFNRKLRERGVKVWL